VDQPCATIEEAREVATDLTRRGFRDVAILPGRSSPQPADTAIDVSFRLRALLSPDRPSCPLAAPGRTDQRWRAATDGHHQRSSGKLHAISLGCPPAPPQHWTVERHVDHLMPAPKCDPLDVDAKAAAILKPGSRVGRHRSARDQPNFSHALRQDEAHSAIHAMHRPQRSTVCDQTQFGIVRGLGQSNCLP